MKIIAKVLFIAVTLIAVQTIYAKPGDKLLDTHSGSGSLACACHLEKFDFIAIEKDPDYHRDSVKRLDELRSQGRLF